MDMENSFQGLLVTDVSDHLPIFYVDTVKADCKNEESILRRNMSQRNKHAFENAIFSFDWSEIYKLSETETAFEWFHSNFLKLYNIHFPKKKS